MRLTKAQHELLHEARMGWTTCVEEYRPAQKLCSQGLAEFRFPGHLYITPAGRAALASTEGEKR